MSRRTRRRLRWGTIAGLLIGGLSLAGSAFAATAWTVVTVPASAPGTNAILQGATLRTAADGWAVGTEFAPAGAATPPGVVYHFNGAGWSPVPTPAVPTATTDGLTAVSASSATDAWAVGLFHAPFTGYHGGNSLYEHWTGTAWSVVSGPNVSGLVGVADLGPGNAYAVSSNGLVVQWNGTAWNQISTPHPNPGDTVGDQFFSMSADGPNDVWAVGTFAQQSTDPSSLYALHFNGIAWTTTSLPLPAAGGILLGVSEVDAVSPANVWVTGSANGGAYVEHYNGAAWAEVALPAGLFLPELTAIAARSATDVWAIGREFTSATSTTSVPMFLHWDGASWSSAAGPAGAGYNQVYTAVVGPGSAFWAFGVNSGNQPLALTHG